MPKECACCSASRGKAKFTSAQWKCDAGVCRDCAKLAAAPQALADSAASPVAPIASSIPFSGSSNSDGKTKEVFGMRVSSLDACASCAHCKKPGATFKCTACKQPWYCGKACQRADWKKGHRDECKKIAAKMKEVFVPPLVGWREADADAGADAEAAGQSPGTSGNGGSSSAASAAGGLKGSIWNDPEMRALAKDPEIHAAMKAMVYNPEKFQKHHMLKRKVADWFQKMSRVHNGTKGKHGVNAGSSNDGDPGHPCPICFENQDDFQVGESRSGMCLGCGQLFCGACTDMLEFSCCPMCRIPPHTSDRQAFERSYKLVHDRSPGRHTPRAQLVLGNMYDTQCGQTGGKSDGVPQDDQKAIHFYRLSADQGLADAQTTLGTMYGTGQGVVKDLNEAGRLFQLAADQGDVLAYTKLGFLYARGYGRPIDCFFDYGKALQHYRFAADQGVAGANTELGIMHMVGQGVPQDYDEAFRLFELAADQGDARAKGFCTKRKELDSTMAGVSDAVVRQCTIQVFTRLVRESIADNRVWSPG